MAAYDWGPGNVQKAVERTGYADFWELYRRNALPAGNKELRSHHHRGRDHGEKSAAIRAAVARRPDPPLLVDTVTTTEYSVDLRLVSDLVEVTGAGDLGPQPQPVADEHAR